MPPVALLECRVIVFTTHTFQNKNNSGVHMAIKTETNQLLMTDVTRELVAQRQLDGGQLAPEIIASWQRSASAGLDNRADVDCGPPSLAHLRELKHQNRLLLDSAAPELDRLARQFSGERVMIMLADGDARLLSVEGDRRALDQAQRYAINPGICWSEQSRGTNALGTALVSGNLTRIDGAEHFLDHLNHFSCTSAPLRDASGNCIGVLDITRAQQPGNPGAELVQMTAQTIENRLFVNSVPEHSVIAIHSRLPYVDSLWRGLLAIDSEGQLVAANEQACQLLGAEMSALVGSELPQLLGTSWPVLQNRLLKARTISLQTRLGELFCALVQLPARPLSLPTTPVEKAVPAPDASEALDTVAGNQPRLRRSLTMALRGLEHDIPVLLRGETGTGKEVAARALHQAGSRADKPFIAVNCAAIPEGLIESELFGYREGAFTGSRRGGMVGRFQQADGGTLFLDEIGDMPLALQARLLRVLQERRVAPLGGGDEVEIDIRLLCATHRDLRTQVQAGEFREDLFYRLNGVGVQLPALRERVDMAEFIPQLLLELTEQPVTIAPDLLQRLLNYRWPGNIRQLETVLRTAVIFMEPGETEISEDHLTDDFLNELDQLILEPPVEGTLKQHEQQAIQLALEANGGNMAATARALGISRATLYRRLQAPDAQ